MGSWAERTRGKVAAGRPREVADCGMGWAKLQLAGKVAAAGQGDRTHNPEFRHGEIKPQIPD